MSANAPHVPFAEWVAHARARAEQPPAQPRQRLWVAGQAVGSVAAGVLSEMCLQRALDKRYELSIQERGGEVEWHLDVPPDAATPALNALANAMNEAGRCGPWRNEQLAVCNPEGEIVGTVERGAVRVLGITTRAVHLVGMAPDGRMWVQKRSQDKPNNPGMWDTLMGGMVSAADTLPEALARETWEEAGLRIADLTGLRQGGHVDFCRPSREGGGVGYMVERIDWFCADVPAGVEPLNQDGEVERFELWSLDTVRQQVAMDAFTLEAGLVIAGYLGV